MTEKVRHEEAVKSQNTKEMAELSVPTKQSYSHQSQRLSPAKVVSL